jgi:hypothetical protein
MMYAAPTRRDTIKALATRKKAVPAKTPKTKTKAKKARTLKPRGRRAKPAPKPEPSALPVFTAMGKLELLANWEGMTVDDFIERLLAGYQRSA